MSCDESKKDTYLRYEQQAWKDAQSSTEDFDKSLLTYSSSALGLSIIFIKDRSATTHATTLLASWVAFALCIAITIISFRLSYHAQYAQLAITHEQIFEGAPLRRCWQSYALTACTYIALLSFLIGIALTILFVAQAIQR